MTTTTTTEAIEAPPRLNPRYVCYMRSRGFEPAQLEAHREAEDARWPGGRAVGFMLWMAQAYKTWAASRGFTKSQDGYHPHELALAALNFDYTLFDAWLVEYAITPEGRAAL
jgi:hypothetical protein